MPIKRAKSKQRRRIKFGDLDAAMRDLKLFFNSKSGKKFQQGFSLEPKPQRAKRRLSSNEKKSLHQVERELDKAINSVPTKKRPRDNSPNFWPVMVSYVPKNVISKALKFRRRWIKGLLDEMRRLHESDLYKKNR